MGYESIYKDKQNQLLDNITNMGEFSYNAEADPAFQAYKKTYGAQGDRAMKNTLGEASALTGGRLNSWATSAAQQAKSNYDQQLMAQVPALQQAAYQMFQDKNNNNMNALNMLSSMDNTAYGRWNDDRNFTYQQGRDEVSDNQWWKNFNYQKEPDTIAKSTAKQPSYTKTYDDALKNVMSWKSDGTYDDAALIDYIYDLPIDDETATRLLAVANIQPKKNKSAPMYSSPIGPPAPTSQPKKKIIHLP
jgi:hypothetical protein